MLVVASRNRLPRLECVGGLAARHTHPDTVHLVSAAATPLGGDVIRIRVIVEEGARLRVRSAAATIALPGTRTPESHAFWDLDVAGELDLDPLPTVVAGASRHVSFTRLRLAAAGRIRLRERVQVGRSDERQGFWSGALHADLGGLPLLRHRVELGAGSVADDDVAAPRACVSELRCPLATFEEAQAGTVMALAAGGELSTWQGDRLAG